MKKYKTTKVQRCREIFCDWLNEHGDLERQPIIQNFIKETGISQKHATTYYTVIKKEFNV